MRSPSVVISDRDCKRKAKELASAQSPEVAKEIRQARARIEETMARQAATSKNW